MHTEYEIFLIKMKFLRKKKMSNFRDKILI